VNRTYSGVKASPCQRLLAGRAIRLCVRPLFLSRFGQYSKVGFFQWGRHTLLQVLVRRWLVRLARVCAFGSD